MENTNKVNLIGTPVFPPVQLLIEKKTQLHFFPLLELGRLILCADQCSWKSLDFCLLPIDKSLGHLIRCRTFSQDPAGLTTAARLSKSGHYQSVKLLTMLMQIPESLSPFGR